MPYPRKRSPELLAQILVDAADYPLTEVARMNRVSTTSIYTWAKEDDEWGEALYRTLYADLALARDRLRRLTRSNNIYAINSLVDLVLKDRGGDEDDDAASTRKLAEEIAKHLA